MYLHLIGELPGVPPIQTTDFPHHPAVVPETKHIVFIVSVCFRSMHSIPSAFRSGFSFLKTCTSFCFHSIHSPQHHTRSGKTPSFRRLHLFRFTQASFLPFPMVFFVSSGDFTPVYKNMNNINRY